MISKAPISKHETYLTLAEAAAFLGVSQPSLSRTINSSRLDYVIIGGRKMVSTSALHAYRSISRPGRPAKKG